MNPKNNFREYSVPALLGGVFTILYHGTQFNAWQPKVMFMGFLFGFFLVTFSIVLRNLIWKKNERQNCNTNE